MSSVSIPTSAPISVPIPSTVEEGPVVSDIIASGPLSLYFHRTDDENWVWPTSYTKKGTFTTYTEMWKAFKTISESEFIGGMYFLMVNPYPPVWENPSHMRGGTYCINIKEVTAYEVFQRYAAAMGDKLATKTEGNRIVGLSISPKKGFHIMKLWNADAKYSNVADVNLYGPDMKASDIRYRPNTDQRF